MFINVVNFACVARLLFRRRELSLGAGAYIASDNALLQKVVWIHEQNYRFGITSFGFILLLGDWRY